MMSMTISEHSSPGADHRDLADALSKALHLAAPPVGISFSDSAPPGVQSFDDPMSEPASDGRAGRVPAGCVFWIRAAEQTFTTAPEDHGNCSVGSLTHGLATLEDIASREDVAALADSGWVDAEAMRQIPTVAQRPGAITYGPVADSVTAPDVVLLRVNGRQMMVLSDALPGLRIEGKPQCHIVAVAKESGEPAASVGCALSRARTGMRPDEMTFAVPGHRLAEVTAAVQRTAAIDSVVAKYAADDARRFG
jgi:uncharacterized protein (DUF169 family)